MPLRSTLVGAASGAALLAGVVGFAVGLPEVTGDEPDGGGTEQSDVSGTPATDLLPEDLLDGALVRYTSLNQELAPLFEDVEAYGGEQLTDSFDTDSAVGVYATPDEQVRVAVTIYNGESGLFIQTGPPVPPEMSANSETQGEYVRHGDAVCFAQYQSQAKAEGGPPFQVQCQLVAGGRTINVYEAGGLDTQQTADLAADVATQAGLS
ncbi:hypothetical protein DJ010_15585 [Nocardioides silvaticus]|uniref:Sensor domain-containing protein n=1 Tax=Nocardioides silvaticus TaxID=2201891 RepID=A0A316TEX4_9ACTN|nr:hypothetical protein [Nocardioides silvaticus]PWN01961.1 hypothetical protein DJ010_15585 [Nocardioides silvaticus]